MKLLSPGRGSPALTQGRELKGEGDPLPPHLGRIGASLSSGSERRAILGAEGEIEVLGIADRNSEISGARLRRHLPEDALPGIAPNVENVDSTPARLRMEMIRVAPRDVEALVAELIEASEHLLLALTVHHDVEIHGETCEPVERERNTTNHRPLETELLEAGIHGLQDLCEIQSPTSEESVAPIEGGVKSSSLSRG